MTETNNLKALQIEGRTLIGVSAERPVNFGNCFSVLGSDSRRYKIVNFFVENLTECIKQGVVFPIQIKVLEDNIAVIHDARIPDEWYRSDFCEACCPEDLLPLPQRLVHEREIEQGVRTIVDSNIFINPGLKPRLKIKSG